MNRAREDSVVIRTFVNEHSVEICGPCILLLEARNSLSLSCCFSLSFLAFLI